MKTVLVLYVPVIHRGYLELIERYQNIQSLFLVGSELLTELTERTEIRALDPETARQLLRRFYIGANVVRILDRAALRGLQSQNPQPRIITANEEITRRLVEKYFPTAVVTFDQSFLRWDQKNVSSREDVEFDRASTSEEDRMLIECAELEGEISSDWWRQVGAILVTPQQTFLAHNVHLPTEYTPYIDGDPRDSIKAGTLGELSSTLHAEKGVFAQALQAGVSTLGSDLYTTVFPCPTCASFVAFSGVKRLFFKTGHTSLNGVKILKSKGVEIVRVE